MIRKARLEDMEACIEIEHSLFGEDKEMLMDYYRKNIKNNDFTILVDELNGKIVGLAIFEYRKWNNTIYVYTLYVAKGFQDKGTGSQLMSEIIKNAKYMKVRRIFLDTKMTNNEKVINFYKKNGFKGAGFIKDYYNMKKCKDALILSLQVK